MDAERANAPDLFRALELEPVHGSGGGAVPEHIDDEGSDEITNPVEVQEVVSTPGAPIPSGAAKVPTGSFSGIADELEPNSAPLMVPPPPATDEVGVEITDAGAPGTSRSGAAPWIAISLLLLGGLGYVLYTETDLFQGDVIERREAQVAAEVEEERARIAAEAQANKKEYGSVQLSTTPDGARVFMLQPGPEATFENLPVAGEYLVLVDAPGHVPRTRLVKGSELASPVVMDLDPLEDGTQAPEIPADEVPEPAPAGSKETGSLVVRSSTEAARLGLLVGFTPGATVVDLDVKETHAFLVDKPGYEPHELVVKGRHYEEAPGGGLLYAESITLQERSHSAAGTGGVETGGAVGEAGAEPAPAPPVEKKKSKKKRRKKRRR